MTDHATPVLIAGGGPVGLTLALELAHHGVASMLVERNATTTRHPKMDITNGRSMELFRRLGLVETLRAAAVPETHPFDVAWVTSMGGFPLHRFRYPDVVALRQAAREANDGTQPLEPWMRISQIVVEPLLRDAAIASPLTDIRYGWRFDDLSQDEVGVTATIAEIDTGREETVRCRYLAGCDGGNSTVRARLGIAMDGERNFRERTMVHFRSRDTDVLQRWGIAWHYQSPLIGTLICQDDVEIWTLQTFPRDGVGAATTDPKDILFHFTGRPIDCEILQANDWWAHLLVAERYRDRRVFLAGDAAHQYVPTGGYGMNTGVGDAVDLGWKLAAVLQRWGGARLLRSYEIERRPVGLRNRDAARRHSGVRAEIATLWRDDIEDETPAGGAARDHAARQIARLGNAENESLGVEMGYVYTGSPVVAADADAPPPEDPLRYHPTSFPGARAPSVFLRDGRALFDAMGPGLTLVDFAADPRVAEDFARAARERSVPLSVVACEDDRARALYQRDLVLLRTDHHVAWRGDRAPGDPGAVLDLVRGV